MSETPNILILGATSAIAQAYARRCAAQGARFALVGRRPQRLAEIAADLLARGAGAAEAYEADLAALDAIDATAATLRSRFGPFDEVVIAYGTLGEQASAERDIAAARAILESNFVSPALWILALLKDHPTERALKLVAIGSVAGDRGRASNYIYGSAKGGLARFLEGLSQEYEATAVRVTTVKPGFVDTPMTAAIAKGGPLWASPDQVATGMIHAVTKDKRVVYTPWFWRPIMWIISHLPWFIFKRLKI